MMGNIAIVLTLVLSWLMSTPIFADASRQGAVYAMTNAGLPNGNEIVVYDRAANGMLAMATKVATDGLGQALTEVDGLGANNPLILSKNRRWLFAVNAGSDEISVFRARRRGLKLVDKIDSGGDFPVSLTLHQRWLYVLNSGGEGNITGFTVHRHTGQLTSLPDSTRSLNVGGTSPPNFIESPANVGFSPKGDKLVVTVKGSNKIHVFAVGADGLLSASPETTISNGNTPFGFTFDRRGHLLVAEAFGTAPVGTSGAGAVSSYSTNLDGTLNVITASLGNSQTATCWIVTTRRKRYAYATSNVSNAITGYRLTRDGILSLLNVDGVTAQTGGAPEDLAITRNGRFLYNVNATDGTVGMFRINKTDGSLTSLGDPVDGLPAGAGAAGIAVR